MNEMNFYTLNGEQYEVADKANREAMAKANQEIAKKADLEYLNQNFAPAIPITLSGNIISTDIAGGSGRPLKCVVSGIPNFPSVKVSQTDGNIFVFRKNTGVLNAKFIITPSLGYKEPDGFIMNGGTFNSRSYLDGVPEFATDKNVVLDFDALIPSGTGNDNKSITVGLAFTDGTYIRYDKLTVSKFDDSEHFTHIFEAAEINGRVIKYVECQPFGSAGNFNAVGMILKNVQLSIEGEVLPYNEGRVLKTFEVGVDGEVKDIESINSNMSILSDNASVFLTIDFIADTKKYIDSKFAALKSAIISTGGNV